MSTLDSGLSVPLQRRAAVQTEPRARLERMMEIRLVEDKIMHLFSEGAIHGTTHTAQGQEAIAVAIGATTRLDDMVAGTYRGHALALALGVPSEAVLGEILGRELGCVGGFGGSMHLSCLDVGLLPTSAIVGAGIPISVGAALSGKVLEEDRVAIAVFGDGAANIGAFHEGLNLAAIWELPVVFVCENNLYGEYSPIGRTTPVGDIAVRAKGYAMPGVIVDGQDIEEVMATMRTAIQRARDGGGPTLIEAKTYRYSGHSRSDMGTYRPAGELESWSARDPVDLYASRLLGDGVLSQAEIDAIRATQIVAIEESVAKALAAEPSKVANMFKNVLAVNQQK
jgi:acetoin:2,6-dichlorophenolindophenol oxidoreductase subunit alpha